MLNRLDGRHSGKTPTNQMKEHCNATLVDHLVEQNKGVIMVLAVQHWDVGHSSWLIPLLTPNKKAMQTQT